MSASTERTANLADVARLAGVSPATASRALGGHPHVAPDTRERVRRIAEELHYSASPDAARLAGGRTGRVAVLVPDLARWYTCTLLEGVAAALGGAGLGLLLYRLGEAAERAAFFRRLPARRTVDAIVGLAVRADATEAARLAGLALPVVAAGDRLEGHPAVLVDDVAAGRQALDHLLHLGHRRIAMICALEQEGPQGRALAYTRALADAGLRGDPDLVVAVEPGSEQGADAMARLLGLREPPTAVYAHCDEIAAGALRTLRRTGLRVPEDVSVVGIDDHPVAGMTDLTTVRRPVREQGALAGDLVLAALAGDDPGPGAVLPTRLVVRGTTAPPREPR